MLDATPPPMASDPASGLAPSTPEGKIKLFRALIRGRPDAYPTRFLSKKTGKPGYARAGSNKLAPGVCGLPKVKCGDCTRQPFNPVDDAAVMVLALRMSEIGEDGIHVTQLKSGGKVAVVIEWTEALRTAVAEAGAIERPVASMHLICNRQGQRYTDSGFKPMWNRLQLAWQEAGGTRLAADLRSPYRETG
jgi:hypothetical protein